MADVPPPIPPARSDEVERVQALKSRACPKCGGKAEWEPRTQALQCPYCGFILAQGNPAGDEELVIREHDLHEALRTLEEASHGIVQGQRKVHCQHCNAESLMPTDKVADRCQFCGSPEIVAYDAIASEIRPESLLPKQIDQSRAYEILKQWAGNRFWAPGDLKRRNLVEHMKGVYLPYWTFDADTACPWTADSGTYYWDTEHYTDAQGRRQTRQVRKVRWRPASGTVHHWFNDVLVPGTRFLDDAQLRAIEPFPTDRLVPYDVVYVSGWTVEHYQTTLLDAAKESRGLMQAVLRNLCARDVPGDTYRNLRIDPRYSQETFKHILVPVWVLVYDYRGKLYKTVVNGYTGKIDGQHPVSGWKIFFAVLIGVLLILLFLLLAGGGR